MVGVDRQGNLYRRAGWGPAFVRSLSGPGARHCSRCWGHGGVPTLALAGSAVRGSGQAGGAVLAVRLAPGGARRWECRLAVHIMRGGTRASLAKLASLSGPQCRCFCRLPGRCPNGLTVPVAAPRPRGPLRTAFLRPVPDSRTYLSRGPKRR